MSEERSVDYDRQKYMEGTTAFNLGTSFDNCPYGISTIGEELWIMGYRAAQIQEERCGL